MRSSSRSRGSGRRRRRAADLHPGSGDTCRGRAARSQAPDGDGVRTAALRGSGGLAAYASEFSDLARRAAIYVDKILKGARPGDLPVEQPTRFQLVFNRKTAKALGIEIPRALLLRADHVVD